jgi:hypothetical protein
MAIQQFEHTWFSKVFISEELKQYKNFEAQLKT